MIEKRKQRLNARPLVNRLSAQGRTLRLELATPLSGTVKPSEEHEGSGGEAPAAASAEAAS